MSETSSRGLHFQDLTRFSSCLVLPLARVTSNLAPTVPQRLHRVDSGGPAGRNMAPQVPSLDFT